MNLPKKIKVGARDYSLDVVSIDKGSRMGECDTMKGTIEVEETLDNKAIITTLLHEIFHAIRNELGLQHKNIDDEELVVGPLSTGFAAVMRDNPKLIAEIQKGLK